MTFVMVNDEERDPVNVAAMGILVKKYVNLHSSMVTDGIYGIVGLDKPLPFYRESNHIEEVGHMTLCHAMYNYVKLLGQQSLFAEIHQQTEMSSGHVVVGNTPEAEQMVLMIKKQPDSFFTHYLKDTGLNATFVDSLVREAI